MPAGYSMMLQMACSNTLIQTMVPDQLRGRVMALYSMMFMGMAPFGALFGGALAHRMGAPVTVAVGGVACMMGALWFWRALPVLRVEAQPVDRGARLGRRRTGSGAQCAARRGIDLR